MGSKSVFELASAYFFFSIAQVVHPFRPVYTHFLPSRFCVCLRIACALDSVVFDFIFVYDRFFSSYFYAKCKGKVLQLGLELIFFSVSSILTHLTE